MSIIDNLFNGWAKKNVPFGYDKRIVMPKSAQDTIPFYEVYDNGLFLTGTNTFTLIFAFSNIDYSLLRDKEQEETYQRYQRLLNALPVEINFQEFIMNSSVNTAKLRDILISNNEEISGDLLDDYNKNLETYITKSEDATSEKITLVAMSYTPNETVDNVNILFRYYTIGFEFPERLKCPVCGKEMIKSSKGWVCTGYKNGCNFFIAGTICGKCITDTIATMLCANKRTRIINGFTSKSGKAFSAALIVKDGKIDFDFPAQSQKRSK